MLVMYSIFGIFQLLGMVATAILNKKMTDVQSYNLGWLVLLAVNIPLQSQMFELSEMLRYCLVALLALGIGITTNSSTIVFCNRNEPKNLTMSLEFAFSIASLANSTVPMLLKEAHPTPFLAVCGYCVVGMAVLCCLDSKKKGKDKTIA